MVKARKSSKKNASSKRSKKNENGKTRSNAVAATKNAFSSMEREEDDVDIKLLKGAEKGMAGIVHTFFKKHVDNYETRYGQIFEGTMFFLNFLAIAFFIADTHQLSDFWHSFFFTGELVLVSFFIVEYAIRMWVADRKVKHFFNIYSIIDLVAILPVMLSFVNLAFFRIFRILRLVRLLRILRFQRAFKSKKTLFGYLNDTELIVIRIVLTVFTIIFIFAGMIWAIESTVHDGFGTIWNALYFAIVTLSTVGYGDITPLSPLGRIVTVIMILTGVALIPWQLGKLLKVVVSSGNKHDVKCPNCGLVGHEIDAMHCKRCGKKLPEKKKVNESD